MTLFELQWWHVPVLFAVGAIASFLNSLSGGGSVISLPILISLGVPPLLANGTNRVAILAGNLGSVLSLRKGGFLVKGVLSQLLFPVVLGAILGAWIAVQMTDTVFRIVLAFALVFVVVSSHVRVRLGGDADPSETPQLGWQAKIAFFLVGFYGGSIQVGVGIVLMYVLTHFTRLDLVRVNALKGLVALVFIFTSTLVFIHADLILWSAAIAQGFGGLLGGWMGGRFQIHRGESLIRKAIQIDALLMAIRLLWDVIQD